MFLYPYGQNMTKDLLEVLDGKGAPFMLMSKKDVLAKKLSHGVVYGILQDAQGRVFVLRTKDNTYDILHTLVRAGEARETALIRVLQKRLHFAPNEVTEGMDLVQLRTNPIANQAMAKEENRTFFLVPFSAQHKEHIGQKHLWLDFDELNGLKKHFSELLSPRLLQLLDNDYLSRLCKTARISS